MLASGPAGQLESWFEYYRIEPFGDEQLMISRAFARLCNVLKELAYMFIPKAQLSPNQLFKDDALVMKLRKKQPSTKDLLVESLRNIENIEPI